VGFAQLGLQFFDLAAQALDLALQVLDAALGLQQLSAGLRQRVAQLVRPDFLEPLDQIVERPVQHRRDGFAVIVEPLGERLPYGGAGFAAEVEAPALGISAHDTTPCSSSDPAAPTAMNAAPKATSTRAFLRISASVRPI